ncbi:MAG: YdbH domain-containing protein [Oleibacter sp.]|nr:YdbH domain-containing protein [Thalassolituus sp.]
MTRETTTETSSDKNKGLLKRGWVQFLMFLLMLIVSLLVAGYLLLIPLLNRWLPPLLDNFIAPGSSIEIKQFTRDKFSVKSLNIAPTANVVVQLYDADLNYKNYSIFRGQADSLHVRRMTIVVGESEVEVSATGAVAPTPAAYTGNSSSNTSHDWLNTTISLPQLQDYLSLPVDKIDIDELIIELPDIALILQASVTPEQWQLTGTAQLSHMPIPVNIAGRLQQQDGKSDLLILLSDKTEVLAQLWLGLSQSDDASYADIRFSADVPTLKASLANDLTLPINAKKISIDGWLMSPNEALWPQDLQTELDATLSIKKSKIAEDIVLSSTKIKAQLQHPSASEDWQLNFSSDALIADYALAANETWRIHSKAIKVAASCANDMLSCKASSVIELMLDGSSKTKVKLSPKVKWTSNDALNITLPLTYDYSQSAQADLPAWSMQAKGLMNGLLKSTGEWQLSSKRGLALSGHVQPYQIAANEQWTLSPLSGQAFTNLEISGNTDDLTRFTSTVIELNLFPWNARSQERELLFGRSSMSCQPGILDTKKISGSLLGECNIELRLQDSHWDLWPIPDMKISGPIEFVFDDRRQQLEATLDIVAANQGIHLRANAEHDLLKNIGSMQWQLKESAINWKTLGLDDMANLTSTELLSGAMSGQGWIDWELVTDTADASQFWQIIPDTMLRLENVSAIYDNSLTLDSWNAMVALRRPQFGDYVLDAQISGSSMDTGVKFSNLLARSQTRFPTDFSYFDLSVFEMHTDVLGGRIYTPLIRYDSRKESNAFGIRMDHIALSELAKIEAKAGIEANGLLDGVLPIIITKDGIQVPGGTLLARDPGGLIRYRGDNAEALKESDQSVGMAMNLLDNFLYNELASGIQYEPDGSLKINLQFQGHNPDFFDGQETHLNVNLDYNLLDLLESLRVTRDVVDKLEQKYR